MKFDLSRSLSRVPRPAKGFSLLEMMIAMTAASIMLALGLPALHDYGLDKRLRAAQAQLQADFNFARHKAVETRLLAVVCPVLDNRNCADDGAWHRGWMLFLDANADHQRQDNEHVIRMASGQQRLAIRSAASRSLVRFSPAGTAPGSNLSIVFCDERGLDAGKKLLVSQSGRVRQAEATSSDSALCGTEDP